MTEIKNRGTEDILIACMDGLTGGTACRLISMLENHTFETLPFVKCLS